MTKETTEVTVNQEFKTDLRNLLVKYIDGPDKMDELPGILCSILSTVVGSLQVLDIEEEEAKGFISDVVTQAWEVEKERTAQAKAMAKVMAELSGEE